MKKKVIRRLARFESVAQDLRRGLEGEPFSWPEWARKLNVPVAAHLGCTLLTATALRKRGFHLAAGAQPVGRAYWGAPLKRYAGLYLVEAQEIR